MPVSRRCRLQGDAGMRALIGRLLFWFLEPVLERREEEAERRRLAREARKAEFRRRHPEVLG